MINKESRPSFSQEGAKERATEEIKEEEKNLINLNSPTEPVNFFFFFFFKKGSKFFFSFFLSCE